MSCWRISMPDRRISVRERVKVIADIERAAFYVNAISAWLGEQGLEVEADMMDASAKGLLASCWMLERPLRAQLPPERWTQLDRQFQ